MSFATLVLLDTVTIIRSALSDDYASVKRLGALDQIWEGSLLLLTSLENTFLSTGSPNSKQSGSGEGMLWAQRFDRAMAQLRAAGLRTSDRTEAIRKYQQLRSQWDSHVQRLAPSMLYSMQQIDAATNSTTR